MEILVDQNGAQDFGILRVNINAPTPLNAHTGVDLVAKSGTPVSAAQTGAALSVAFDAADFGYYIIIQSSDATSQTLYAHLEGTGKGGNVVIQRPGGSPLQAGESVTAGEAIAYSGHSGREETNLGAHLHFQYAAGGGPAGSPWILKNTYLRNPCGADNSAMGYVAAVPAPEATGVVSLISSSIDNESAPTIFTNLPIGYHTVKSSVAASAPYYLAACGTGPGVAFAKPLNNDNARVQGPFKAGSQPPKEELVGFTHAGVSAQAYLDQTSPIAPCQQAASTIYVANADSGLIAEFDQNGNPLASFGSGVLTGINYYAVPGHPYSGDLLVISLANIEVYTPAGALVGTFAAGEGGSQLTYDPIARDTFAGYVYETGPDGTIDFLNPNLQVIKTVGGSGTSVTFDSANHDIYNLSNPNSYVFDQQGNRVSIPGSFPGLYHAEGATYSPATGYIYAANNEGGNVLVFDANGNAVPAAGGFANLANPYSVAFDANGYVYVTLEGENRVLVFDPVGNPVTVSGSFPGLSKPWGITTGPPLSSKNARIPQTNVGRTMPAET